MDSPIAEEFHDFGSHLDYPMFIVTTAAGAHRAGCLVGFTSQCAISPPRFVVFLSNKNFTYRVAQAATHLGVHVVPEDRDDLARLFGEETGDDLDKFDRCEWERGAGGVPVLSACRNRFVGRIAARFDSGDHSGLFLEPEEVHSDGGASLSFQRAMEFEPGHEA